MKKLNEKGFTLIELLAVIVILGLLMAIAIPSVTKYINQSRKKTLVSSINSYISAVTVAVNDQEFNFTDSNKIYAVPIDCIALEKGGNNPFGDWKVQKEVDGSYESTGNFAYVLVQYSPGTNSYTYGFTFRDSAGYGMMPTVSNKIDSKGKDITSGALKDVSFVSGDDALIEGISWGEFRVEEDDAATADVDEGTKLVVLGITGSNSNGTCARVE